MNRHLHPVPSPADITLRDMGEHPPTLVVVPTQARNSLSAFDMGQESGIALGVARALKVIARYRSMAVRASDDAALALLDEIADEITEEAE